VTGFLNEKPVQTWVGDEEIANSFGNPETNGDCEILY